MTTPALHRRRELARVTCLDRDPAGEIGAYCGGHAYRVMIRVEMRISEVRTRRQGIKQNIDDQSRLVLVLKEVQGSCEHERDRLREVAHRLTRKDAGEPE